MSYLKIFPRSIKVKQDGDGGYAGHLMYDFEHYGCMTYDDDSAVELLFLGHLQVDWLIRTCEAEHRLNGFAVFMHAMNHYLFEVLQFDPVSQWSRVSASEYEYHFDRVYFDMSTRQFNAVKENIGSRYR